MNILLNEEEQQLLRNASLEARSLYVLCLRPAMDVKTGTVGRHSNVALTHWAGHVAFRPLRGSKRPAWMPTTRHLERLIDELCHPQIGLVKRINTPSDRRKVVLLLPFSGFGGLVRPREDAGMLRAGCGHVAGCDDAANSTDLSGENDILPGGVVDDVCSEERGISEISVDIDIPRACARESELAAVASKLGVSGDIPGWVAAGVTPAILKLAVVRSRVHVRAPRRIPASYLAQVLETVLEGQERPVRPTAKPAASQGRPARPGNRWVKVAPDCAFDGLPPVSGNMPPEAAGGGDDWIE